MGCALQSTRSCQGTTDQQARPGSTVTLRSIIRRSPDGHQIPILTNRTDLTMTEVSYRMGDRWLQENYFTYARENFAPDALDSDADHQVDLTRLVPNSAKALAVGKVAVAGVDLVNA